MKLNFKIFRSAWLVAATAMCLTSCSDEINAPEGDDFQGGTIELKLHTPDFAVTPVGSRAVDENGVKNLTVIGYSRNGECVSLVTYPQSALKVDGADISLSIELPKTTARVEVVANAAELLAQKPTSPLTKIYTDASLANAANMVMWGGASMSELLQSAAGMSLIRQSAKVSATNLVESGFKLTGVKVCGTSRRGSIAPTIGSDGQPTLTLAADDACDLASAYVTDGQPVYIYETAADKACMIVKGEYKGETCYYKVGFLATGTNTPLDLRRNHHYTVNIKEVKGKGFATEDEALKGDTSNRVVTEILDHDPLIFNIIGSNDYALGVGDEVVVDASATKVEIPVIVIAPNPSQIEAPQASTVKGNDWIGNITVGNPVTVAEGNYTSPAQRYTVTVEIKPNSTSTETRDGEIVIRLRDVSASVTIHQRGTDFKRDPARRVTLKIGSEAITTDYFTWIDNTVKGLSPEAMQGAVRNEGFHFSTETDAAKYVYSIPKLSGDVLKNVSRNNIKVSDNGSEWIVTITDGATAATTMWQSNFTITNGNGIDIVYPVYRTGVLHNITSAIADRYQVPEIKKTGWYYYETVAVKGKDGKTYYILDRNIGAESNGPFSLATAALGSNQNSIGAYCKISDAAAGDNVKPSICPTGFTVPSSTQLSALGFVAGKYQTYTGELYNCASVKTDGANSLIPEIFIPTGGYTEGNNYKNSNHAMVWSSTYLSGAQGFSQTSAEFRFWFLYFDCYGTIVTMSNMRFCGGGAGQIGAVYKGMPVRCVRGDSSKPNDGGSSGEVSTITVYWTNSSENWNPPYIYSFDSNGTPTSGTWPGKAMTWSGGAVYRAVVPKGSSIIFANEKGDKQYPASSGFTAVDKHIYGPMGDLGTFDTNGQMIFWDNSGSAGWTAPKVYYWKASNGSDNAGWPGKAMNRIGSTNYWTYTIPNGYDRVIVNNGTGGTVGKEQTCDMNLSAGIVYSLTNHYSHKAD